MPQVPWRAAGRMRERLVHHYFDINLDILWRTITEDLPQLLAALPSEDEADLRQTRWTSAPCAGRRRPSSCASAGWRMTLPAQPTAASPAALRRPGAAVSGGRRKLNVVGISSCGAAPTRLRAPMPP